MTIDEKKMQVCGIPMDILRMTTRGEEKYRRIRMVTGTYRKKSETGLDNADLTHILILNPKQIGESKWKRRSAT